MSGEPPRTKSVRARGLTLGDTRDRTVVLRNVCNIRHIFVVSGYWGCTEKLFPTKRWCEKRVVGSGIRDSRPMKQRFKNANLRIIHVLDSCVKLLAVLGQPGDIKYIESISGPLEGPETSDDGMYKIAQTYVV